MLLVIVMTAGIIIDSMAQGMLMYEDFSDPAALSHWKFHESYGQNYWEITPDQKVAGWAWGSNKKSVLLYESQTSITLPHTSFLLQGHHAPE